MSTSKARRTESIGRGSSSSASWTRRASSGGSTAGSVDGLLAGLNLRWIGRSDCAEDRLHKETRVSLGRSGARPSLLELDRARVGERAEAPGADQRFVDAAEPAA